MKKSLFTILFALLPILASAESIEIKGVYYNLDAVGKTAEVTKHPNKYTGDVVIPKSVKYEGNTYKVTSIDGFAFSFCYELTSVAIPNTVTAINIGAFEYCSALTSITIPNSVTLIGSFAFEYCTGLTSVVIPNSVTDMNMSVFKGCTGLTSVTLSNNITHVDWYAFQNCTGLTSVVIPNSVTEIDKSAFEGCSHLTSVSIGNGIKKIRARAFANCAKLTNVYCFAEEVPNTEEDVFEETPIGNATLRVPAGSVDAYKAEVPWSGFKSIVKISATVKLNKSKLYIGKGKSEVLIPTITPTSFPDKSVTWKSSNTKVATVTSKGKVKGVKAGTATITCTSAMTGSKTTCKVTVVNGDITLNKTEAVVEKGKTMKLKATLLPADLEDKSVTWTSSDTKIATVSSSGKVKGVKYGTVTITCTSNATKLSATCQVTVGKVFINVSEITLKRSRTIVLTPMVYPKTLEDMSVTWTSSDTKIATVTSEGKVKGIKAGTATITCTSVATGLSGTCIVTVLSSSESRSADSDDDETTGIKKLEEVPALAEPYDVYDLSGRKVRQQVTSLDGLPEGVYIVNGKKMLKK